MERTSREIMAQEILLIEDDDTIRTALKYALEDAGYQTLEAESMEAVRRVSWKEVDLILLDLGLPDGHGLQFCDEVCRAGGPAVIIVTAQDDEQDIICGLNTGADDYVTKPFKLGVLLSRIGAVLRRRKREETESMAVGNTIVCGPVTLYKSGTTATADGKQLQLTVGEYRLLEYLMENKNRTVTRAMILGALWDQQGNYVEDNALTVLMRRLREKLGPNGQQIIRTVRGIGYKAEDGYEK